MFENIPNELKFDALWCCWKKTDKGKVPFDAKLGTLAKSNDKRTFYSYKTILNNVQKYLKFDEDGRQLGGIGLGIFNGFSAIDIDHCVENGKISEMAQEIIDYCQSYTELSPSGTGIRIIFKTDYKDFDKTKYYTNNSKIGLEIYIEGATNKFVTMTGNVLFPNNVANVDVTYILNRWMLKKYKKVEKPQAEYYNNDIDINKFIAKDRKLNELWNSHASGSGGNESETDLALCSKLAFYCQKDYNKIAQMFESSPYFASKDDKHKRKWLEREDYKINTINEAISGCNAVYNPVKYVQQNNNAVVSEKIYQLNDTGNAHRFVDKFNEDIRYNVDNKCWMIWNGMYWQFDVFNSVKNLAEALIEEMRMEALTAEDEERRKSIMKNVNRLSNSSGKEAMLKESQHLSFMPVSNEMFDKDDYYFNCKNGTIDLLTGNLFQHNKNQLLAKYSDVEYLDETPHRFIQFLNEIFEYNQDIIDYVQKMFGYGMTGSTKEQKMFLFVGDGSNGKSLLLQIINEVMGDYYSTSSVELLLDKKTQSSNLSEVARLKGVRGTITGESKLGDKLNESAIKSLTGGNDKITARFLYGNEFEFYPKMKIFMATNYEPIIRGTDNGIWRRMVKIPFNKIFNEQQQDKDLIQKLRLEKSGILNWMVQGCLKWQKEGLVEPSVIQDEVKKYRTDMDLVSKWIDENCELDNSFAARAKDLFENFSSYCASNKEFMMSNTLFGRNIGKKFRKVRKNGVFYYVGIRLRSDI